MLRVDVSALEVETAVYEKMTTITLTNALEERGFGVSNDEGEGTLTVALAWEDYDNSTFKISWSVAPSGQDPQEVPAALCEQCSDDEFAAMLASQLDDALTLLDPPAKPGETAPPPTKANTEPYAPTEPATQPPDKQFRVAPLTGVGIGIAALGVAGLVTGGVLIARPDKTSPASGGALSIDTKTFRPPGIGLLAGGGAALATGVGLIVAGQLRQRRGKQSASSTRSSRLSWSPLQLRRGVALSVSGRF